MRQGTIQIFFSNHVKNNTEIQVYTAGENHFHVKGAFYNVPNDYVGGKNWYGNPLMISGESITALKELK